MPDMNKEIKHSMTLCFQCDWFIDEICSILLRRELIDNLKNEKNSSSLVFTFMFAVSKQISSLIGKLSIQSLCKRLPSAIIDQLTGVRRLDVDCLLAPQLWENIQRNISSQQNFWNALNQLPNITLLIINQKQITSLLSCSREKNWPCLKNINIIDNSKSPALENYPQKLFSLIPTLQTICVISKCNHKQNFIRNDYTIPHAPTPFNQTPEPKIPFYCYTQPATNFDINTPPPPPRKERRIKEPSTPKRSTGSSPITLQ